MSGVPDYYALLGVPRNAMPEQIRHAYREAALRLHPDRNIRPGETELFMDVNRAYEVLNDPAARVAYDEQLRAAEAELISSSNFGCTLQQSRRSLLQLDEPQVHYLLMDIRPAEGAPTVRPPVNLCIVIDRSTSMRGQRLDMVRSAAQTILDGLQPTDTASVIAFSDRAEVIVSPSQAKDRAVSRARLSLLQAGGGTAIAQGLETGLTELGLSFNREGVNHLVLITDGRTYGDEAACLEMADRALRDGVTISGVGIGTDWNDRFLDDMTSRTGGAVVFLDTPRAVTALLQRTFDALSRVFANKVTLSGAFAQQVDLRAAFRLLPEPTPMGDSLPLALGHLPRDGRIRLLLELVVHPIGPMDELALANLMVKGDVLGAEVQEQRLPVEIRCKVSHEADSEPPPTELLEMLNIVVLYRMQEKARHEAELGQAAQAARRLETLATHLLAGGERELAKAALSEAERLVHTRHFSVEGEKRLKYGTRALLLPSKTSAP
ncbi:MAG: VWA domain-containing protein [Chloroflexota bacterium]